MINFLIVIIIALIMSACGKKSESETSVSTHEQQEELQGAYKAVLRPLNSPTSGWIPYGNAEITVDENNIAVTTYLDDDQKVLHIQSIHEGQRCPSSKDDINKDGVIDAVEALSIVGKVLIPLDGDISSQKKGEYVFPVGSSFTYERKALRDDIIKDLYSEDEKPNDTVRKLRKNDPFNLNGKVVLIHGIALTNKLPNTIQTHNGLLPHLSVPIVCGTIKRLK